MLRSKSEPNKCTKCVHGCRTQNNTVQCAAGAREYVLRPVCYDELRTDVSHIRIFYLCKVSGSTSTSERYRLYLCKVSALPLKGSGSTSKRYRALPQPCIIYIENVRVRGCKYKITQIYSRFHSSILVRLNCVCLFL